VDLSDVLVAVLVVLGVLVLVGLAVIVFVMRRYRVPPSGVVAMVAALAYLASPLDVLPEAVLGPFGLVDDAGVVTGAAFFVYRLVTARRMLSEAGVRLPSRRTPPR
jgi:uncharacterized membrane protein YkvA (DUF1232 family)